MDKEMETQSKKIVGSELETILAEIENSRKEIHEIVDKQFDDFVQRMVSGELTSEDTVCCAYLASQSKWLKGKKPVAVVFSDSKEVEVKTWKAVVGIIMQDCNSDSELHDKLMQLRGRVNGNFCAILSGSPDGMKKPIKIDEELYVEAMYDTETMLNVLKTKLLDIVGYDYHGVVIKYRR